MCLDLDTFVQVTDFLDIPPLHFYPKGGNLHYNSKTLKTGDVLLFQSVTSEPAEPTC